jgi:3-hydroxypropanoate dehydrogenase
VIVAQDLAFYENLPKTFPQADAKAWFIGNQSMIEATAFRNSSLQGAYLILAARALGLDAGPMSGFDAAQVDRAFFPEGRIKSNFLVNLGYGDPAALPPRNPRLSFEDACQIV